MDSGAVLKGCGGIVYQRRKKVGGWAELNPELLDEIAKHIYLYADYLRFRAVCKPWNISLPKISKHLSRPWLVLPFDDATVETYGYSDCSSMKKAESYLLRLPQLLNSSIRGSCFGWLITLTCHGTEGELRILNPFRISDYFLLPPLSTFPNRALVHNFNVDMTRDIGKIILSSSPEEEGFMAVAIHSPMKDKLAFCRAGDVKWTDITKNHMTCFGGFRFTDVIFHLGQGKIYAVDGFACLYEYDMKTLLGGVIRQVRPPPYFDPRHWHARTNYLGVNPDGHLTNYLVVNQDGHLLLLVRHFNFRLQKNSRTFRFDVYKLDQTTRQWCKQSSLGNFVIFVGYNASICRSPFVDEDGNWKKNCIYYTSEGFDQDFGVFNLEDGKSQQLFPCPLLGLLTRGHSLYVVFPRHRLPPVMAWI